MPGCVHGSLSDNGIGPEGCAVIAGALQHAPRLTELQCVVGEGWMCSGTVGCGSDGDRAEPLGDWLGGWDVDARM